MRVPNVSCTLGARPSVIGPLPQSAKLFLQSSEMGLPQPLTRRASVPPPPGSGGKGTLAGERGVGRVPIPTRGHTLWHSFHIYTYPYFVPFTHQHRRPASSDRPAANGGLLRRLQLRPVGGTRATVAK